jgi:uncharacterized DUF497 family protein
MATIISEQIKDKLLSKHCVSAQDVEQCFANKIGLYLIDKREDHKSDPPTLWFIAETDDGRLLKIVFIPKDGNNYIRSAFKPNETEIRIYNKFGR